MVQLNILPLLLLAVALHGDGKYLMTEDRRVELNLESERMEGMKDKAGQASGFTPIDSLSLLQRGSRESEG